MLKASPLPQGRELKLGDMIANDLALLSPLPQGRELKFHAVNKNIAVVVAPPAGA